MVLAKNGNLSQIAELLGFGDGTIYNVSPIFGKVISKDNGNDANTKTATEGPWLLLCANYLILSILVFFFIKKEVIFGGVIGPDVFDGLVDFSFVLEFFKVLDYFLR